MAGMDFAADLEACLREIAASSPIEVRENGARVATLDELSWELRGAPAKPLLRLWSEQCNLTRRVLAIADHSEQRLALAVERFGRAKPGRLEFLRVEFVRSARDVFREEFCARLGRILAERFPDEVVESLTVAADLEHSLSRNYARALMRSGSTHWAVLAVPEGEPAEHSEHSLTFGLLWLDRARETVRRGTVLGLRLIVSKSAAATLVHHVRGLHSSVKLEIYEFDYPRDTLTRIDPNAAANLTTWLVPYRQTQLLVDQARVQIEPMVALYPHAITVHPTVQSGEVWLRFRGLAFARIDDGNVFFGSGERWNKLTSASEPDLKKLLKQLEIHRQPLASETRHPLYRQQAERWLETMVRKDVTRVDAALDSRFAYAQVFANTAAERGILDLLAVTRSGRLAIIELKAYEHIHLPMQAAGYWNRIRHHLQQGDFQRNGYFTGVELQQAPPLVYLVAPLLRFHPTTDALLRHVCTEMEVVRVGLAESWRRGLRVVMRQ
jgi:hypothetical protein